jgi:hypothetical protein
MAALVLDRDWRGTVIPCSLACAMQMNSRPILIYLQVSAIIAFSGSPIRDWGE